MKYSTALQKVKRGEFRFIFEPQEGSNIVGLTKPNGAPGGKFITLTDVTTDIEKRWVRGRL